MAASAVIACLLIVTAFPASISLPLKRRKFMPNISIGNFAESKLGTRIKKLFNIIAPCVAAAAVGAYIFTIGSYDLVLKANIDGDFVGYVSSADVMNSAECSVERKLSLEIGGDYSFNPDISYSLTLGKSSDCLTESQCEEKLDAVAGKSLCEAYMLYVDGKHAASNEDYEGLEKLINDIENQLVESADGKFSKVQISNSLSIVKQRCPISSLKSLDEINSLLNPLAEEQIRLSRNVRSEPTEFVISAFTSLAPGFDDLSISGGNIETGSVDDSLTLDYTFVKTMTAVETVEPNIVYVDSDKRFIGTEKVVAEGSKGQRSVVYEINYDLDGNIVGKTEVSSTVITPAEDRVIERGTKEIPDAVPLGNFIWPCETPKGVSSYYGSRSLFDSYDFHLGIDIPDVVGSSVWASDGGKVIFADQTPSYGNCVRIQHNDGLVTLYAHLSEILVSEGDMVYQGQEIGLMGKTGVATGVHLHFEIRKGYLTVDPMNYLPKKK